MSTSQVLRIPDSPVGDPLTDKEIAYLNHRLRNHIYGVLIRTFATAVEKHGVTRASIADRAGWDRSQVTRLLSAPSNLQLDSISLFLGALGAELTAHEEFLADRAIPNQAPALVEHLETLDIISESDIGMLSHADIGGVAISADSETVPAGAGAQ